MSSDAPGNDTDLRCPTCGYNLTGLPQNRCPECGQTFSLTGLKLQLRYRSAPITPRRWVLHLLGVPALFWIGLFAAAVAAVPHRYVLGSWLSPFCGVLGFVVAFLAIPVSFVNAMVFSGRLCDRISLRLDWRSPLGLALLELLLTALLMIWTVLVTFAPGVFFRLL